MTEIDGDCRIRDIVRNSKILRDIPSNLYQNVDSLNGDLDGWRHRLNYGHHRVGRDFPRTTRDGVAAGFYVDSHMESNTKGERQVPCSLNQNSRMARQRVYGVVGDLPRNSSSEQHLQPMGFTSSFEEVERWFLNYMDKEAPFLGVYRRDTNSESIISRFKRNLPDFDGFWHIEDLLSWIDAIEDFFEETNPPKHVKCNIVWYKMKGRAYYWWKQLQQERNEHGEREVTSWATMKNMILNRFSPTTCSTKLPNQLYKQEKREEMKHSMVEDFVPAKCLMNVQSSASVGNFSNEERNDDDKKESFVEEQSETIVELKPAACSTKVPFESDIEKYDEGNKLRSLGVSKPSYIDVGIETLEKTISHLLMPIEGPAPTMGLRVNTCVGFHMGNELLYEFGRVGCQHFFPGGVAYQH